MSMNTWSMDTWIEIATGPLFRIAFTVMILGLARIRDPRYGSRRWAVTR